jgi:hypothetical protein
MWTAIDSWWKRRSKVQQWGMLIGILLLMVVLFFLLPSF